MTATRELWTAMEQQARLWSQTPIVSIVSAKLPRNAPQRTNGVPGVLQELHAGFSGAMTQPLRLGSIVPLLLDLRMVPGTAAASAYELNQWLDAAKRLEAAHRSTLAWLRSRLPGYPIIRSPQLVAGTPLTTLEWTSQLIWTPNERRQGLQLQASPPNVDSNLDVRGAAGRDLAESARAVVSALESTEEWLAFGDAVKALDEPGKADLRAAAAHLANLLSPEAVDAHEPDLMLPRDNYRAHVTANVINSLEGAARSYADAFTAANELIDTSASEVFGQLAMYGDPIMLPVIKLDLQGGVPTKVSFEITADYIFNLDCGNVAWLNDSLVSDVVRVESLSTSLDATGEGRIKVDATVLENTGEAWSGDPHDTYT